MDQSSLLRFLVPQGNLLIVNLKLYLVADFNCGQEVVIVLYKVDVRQSDSYWYSQKNYNFGLEGGFHDCILVLRRILL